MSDNIQPVIIFDGYCYLCSGSIRFIIKRDIKKKFVIVPLQSRKASEIKILPPIDIAIADTILLIEGDKIWQKSAAILRILRHLGFPWNIAYILIIIPPVIRDAVYMVISRNRYKWFGKRKECFLVDQQEK